MHGFGDPILCSDHGDKPIHTDTVMAEVCVWNKWREAHSEET